MLTHQGFQCTCYNHGSRNTDYIAIFGEVLGNIEKALKPNLPSKNAISPMVRRIGIAYLMKSHDTKSQKITLAVPFAVLLPNNVRCRRIFHLYRHLAQDFNIEDEEDEIVCQLESAN